VFDLRYHAASLAAVFLALIIGILVGVGITRGGFVSSAERGVLNSQISALKDQRDTAAQRITQLEQEEQANQDYVQATYPALIADRLREKKIVLVSVGTMDPSVRSHVIQALRDAGAPYPVRIRTLKVPIDDPTLDAALVGHPALAQYRGSDKLPDLGRALAGELVAGDKTPLWDLLAPELVQERLGGSRAAADGVVVARSVKAQKDGTARFLQGFYSGLAGAGVPAVGVEVSGAASSAIPAFERSSLSTVDSIDLAPGQLALALVLAGGEKGNYGVEGTATNGVLPLVPAPTTTSG
jgi:Copper transport outer membrane protein, MctB